MNINQRLSKNFTLNEFLRSSTAERDEAIAKDQFNPPENIVANLAYLCSTTLQPIRDMLGVPLRITSGYRCPSLNTKIGGSKSSQHMHGQAADVQLPDRFLSHPATRRIRRKISERVLAVTGRPLRSDVNANFQLFAYVCLRINELDIDQVIHEFGNGYGQPAWVHLATSPGNRDKRQILTLGRYLPNRKEKPDLITALNYGTDYIESAAVA